MALERVKHSVPRPQPSPHLTIDCAGSPQLVSTSREPLQERNEFGAVLFHGLARITRQDGPDPRNA